MKRLHTTALLVFAAVLGLTAAVHAAPITQVVAVTGDAAPDGDGTFDTFRPPALNELGQAAFMASLENTLRNDGIFRGDGVTPVVQMNSIPRPTATARSPASATSPSTLPGRWL